MLITLQTLQTVCADLLCVVADRGLRDGTGRDRSPRLGYGGVANVANTQTVTFRLLSNKVVSTVVSHPNVSSRDKSRSDGRRHGLAACQKNMAVSLYIDRITAEC